MSDKPNRSELLKQIESLKTSLDQERHRRRVLENAIESLDEGFLLCDKADRLLFCNSAYQKTYNLPAALIAPGTPFETILRAVRTGKDGAFSERGGVPVSERLALRHQGNQTFEQEISGGRWLKNSDRKTRDGGIVGLRVDITPLRQAELSLRRHNEYLATLHEMSLGIINRKDLAHLLVTIVRRAAALVGAENGFIHLFDAEKNELEFKVGTGKFQKAEGFRPEYGKGQAWKTLLENRPLVTDDYSNWDEAVGEGLFADLRSCVTLPLKPKLGVIGLGSFEGNEQKFGREEIDVLGRFAEMAAIAIDNARLYETLARELEHRRQAEIALEESEYRFHQIFTHMGSGVAIYEAAEDGSDFIFKDINPAGAAIGKRSGEEHIGRSVQEVYPGVQDLGLFSALQHTWKTGEPVSFFMSQYQDERVSMWVDNYVCKLPSGEIVTVFSDVTEQKKTQEALRTSEKRVRGILDSVGAGIFTVDPKTRTVNYMNPAAEQILGAGILGKKCFDVICGREKDKCPILDMGKIIVSSEREMLSSDGRRIPVLKTVSLGVLGEEECLIESFIDLTELKNAKLEKTELEAQLQQAQKMESLGRLAGGIAHDFNNLLTPILGYAALLLEDMIPEGSRKDALREVHKAGERGQSIIRRLLAFSRKQALETRNVSLNDILSDFEKLLRRTIREDILIEFSLSPDLPDILADIGQIEQAIMNLSVNAQDAMPQGGKLHIETGIAERDDLDDEDSRMAEHRQHVQLTFRDTGHGIDPETLEKIFDPFFTTKDIGEGTGLGLAMVYGIIQQHKGVIRATSEIGKGTCFRIYLPAVPESAAKTVSASRCQTGCQGTETVLVVEDDEMVRRMAQTLLEREGYAVISASGIEECTQKLADHNGPVHLILTDVVMPDMNGKDVVETLSKTYPDVKALFMSGYTDNVIAHHGILDKGIHYIQKPFTVKALSSKIREVLDRG